MSTPSVVIVDYGLCNLDSIRRAIEECGGNPVVTDRPESLKSANHVVLPGVGAFPDAMEHLRKDGMAEALQSEIMQRGVPFLGICLGMQLMARKGFEVKETPAFGWIDGEVVRLEPTGRDTRIPHVGWNEVNATHDDPLFEGIPRGKDFYFVHSYHMVAVPDAQCLARTPYANGFTSAVRRDNFWGVQFHPEKSQLAGFRLLRNFLQQ